MEETLHPFSDKDDSSIRREQPYLVQTRFPQASKEQSWRKTQQIWLHPPELN